MDAELELLLDEHFLDDIARWDVDGLRRARTRCQHLETSLSYLRRLAQGRIDIVANELARRERGGDPTDLDGLLAELPDILAERTRAGGVGHFPRFLDPGDIEGSLVEELAGMQVEVHLSELPDVSNDWLMSCREQLSEFETRVSGLRRKLFDHIDAIQDELTRRYRNGEANIDSVIAGG